MSDGAEEISAEMSIAQINDEYRDRWVAVLVTKRDENYQPIAGKVVASEVDRYRLRLQIVKYDDICIFYAGDTPYPLLL